MPTIRGTLKDGQIILTAPPPADWPDGAEVRLELVDPAEVSYGLREEDWPLTPENIAIILVRMDEVQPFIRTPEEEEELRRVRQERKEWEIANWEKHAKKIGDLFQ